MQVGRPGDPAYAGIQTFAKLPLVLEPEELAGYDVAIVGAPIDEAVSFRPGARFGPRAIRQAENSGGTPSRPNMDVGIDPFEVLRVVDHGDAPVRPADPAWSHESLRSSVLGVYRAGAIPIVLGGDHSIEHPDVSAAAEHFGKGQVGMVHFDAHADDAEEVYGVVRSHGTPLRLLVNEGSLRGEHVVQVGLRGYWPGPEEFEWARAQGFRWHLMDEIAERGFRPVLDDVVREAAEAPRTFLSVDIDVCDPAAAPGTGTPEPGGLTSAELLRAVRRLCAELDVCGLEVVEVCPPYDPSGITALLAHRVVLEALSGIALRRTGRSPEPERP